MPRTSFCLRSPHSHPGTQRSREVNRASEINNLVPIACFLFVTIDSQNSSQLASLGNVLRIRDWSVTVQNCLWALNARSDMCRSGWEKWDGSVHKIQSTCIYSVVILSSNTQVIVRDTYRGYLVYFWRQVSFTSIPCHGENFMNIP